MLGFVSVVIAGDVYPRIAAIDSDTAEVLFAKVSAKLGQVVLKQTIVTPGPTQTKVETFVIDLHTGYRKTLTTELPSLGVNSTKPLGQKVSAGYLQNGQGRFMFDPTLNKWRRDPFLNGHDGNAINLEGARWKLAHVLIDTMSFKMRTRDAYKTASLEAKRIGDERRSREFAEEYQSIPIPHGAYSEMDEGYTIPKWTEYTIGLNDLVLEAIRHETNSESRIVERVRNEIIPKYSFDLAEDEVPPREDFITSRKVNPSESETQVIGLELTESDGSVLVSNIYTNSPAAKAGVHSGDRLLSVNGGTPPFKVDHAKQLIDRSAQPVLTVTRAGERLSRTTVPAVAEAIRHNRLYL